MPKNIIIDADGQFVATADMTRQGMDLHLTAPDGKSVVIEGYFSQDPPPDLITHDGARLSPQLVDSFLPPEHVGQYAASGQTVTDESPAGKIIEVVGDAHIVRADGTKVPATMGTPVYQGDVIETSKTGAVNILFADNTTFAVSESARLSVDKFVYDSEQQSGSSFFSMLQGVFVYTSGLIGKTDPGNVNIETPVGSIGIRGTVVAGQINPAGGEDSKITILDGAVTFTNGSGTQELSNGFDTLSLNGYQDSPDMGKMDGNIFKATYGSLSGVADDTMGRFNDVAPQSDDASAAEKGEGTGPAEGSVDGEGVAPAPANDAAPPPADGSSVPPAEGVGPQPGSAAPEGPAPDGQMMMPPPGAVPEGQMPGTYGRMPDGTMMPDGAMMPPPGTVPGAQMPGAYGTMPYGAMMMPPPGGVPGMQVPGMGDGTTFGAMPGMYGGFPNQGFAPMMSGAYGGTASYYGGDGTGVYAPPPPVYTTGPLPGSITTGTSTSPSFYLDFMFSPHYLNRTPSNTTDDGLREFASAGTIVGKIEPRNAFGAVTYTMTVSGGNALDPSMGIIPDSVGAGNYTTTTLTAAELNAVFLIDAAGFIRVNNPLALSHFVNQSGFDIRITATDGAGATHITERHIGIQDFMPGLSPRVANDVAIADVNGAGADFLVSTGTAGISLTSNGGADVLIGNAGDNQINIFDDQFRFIDGGAGDDTIRIGASTSTRIMLNTNSTDHSGDVVNIERIDLGTSVGSLGNQLNFDLRSVFEMTDSRRTLEIVADGGALGSAVNVIIGANQFNLFSGTLGSGILEYRGYTPDNQLVTLKISQGAVPTAAGGIAVTQTVVMTPMSFTPVPGGVGEFAAAGTVVGHVVASGAHHYQIAVNGANNPQHIVSDNDADGSYTTSSFNFATAFSINAAGEITVNDSMVLSHFLNPGGLRLTVTAYDGVGDAIGVFEPLVQMRDYNGTDADILPKVFGTYTGTVSGSPGADFMVGNNTGLEGGGGADVIIGGAGDNIIQISDAGFKFVDGGAGFDTLKLQNVSSGFMLDFTSLPSDIVRNIEKIDLGLSGSQGSDITLNIQDVFEMTDASHALTITANSSASNSIVYVSGFTMMNGGVVPGGPVGALGGAISNTLTYTGVYNGNNVTLIINQNNGITGSTGDITVTNV